MEMDLSARYYRWVTCIGTKTIGKPGTHATDMMCASAKYFEVQGRNLCTLDGSLCLGPIENIHWTLLYTFCLEYHTLLF